MLLLVAVVLSGIDGGVFAATEGAGIGAIGAFGFALARRILTLKTLAAVLVESACTAAMLFSILIAAMVLVDVLLGIIMEELTMALLKDVPLGTTFRGLALVCVPLAVGLLLLLLFPAIALWLPGLIN